MDFGKRNGTLVGIYIIGLNRDSLVSFRSLTHEAILVFECGGDLASKQGLQFHAIASRNVGWKANFYFKSNFLVTFFPSMEHEGTNLKYI